MTKDSKLKLAKVLIALSFVLILLGVGLNLETNVLIQPTRNTHTIASSTPADINITTTDTPISETTTTETPQKKPDKSKGTNSSQSSSTGSSSSNNNTGNNYQAKKPQQNATVPETIESKNNTLRNQIENKYNVDIRYGTETNGYAVGGLSTVMLTDANRINALLNELNRNLALYPNSFFKETIRI